jgi:hypothetical protein
VHIPWRFDIAFRGNFQGTFEGELDLTCGLLTRVAVRHDAWPFDDLGDKAFVTLFG